MNPTDNLTPSVVTEAGLGPVQAWPLPTDEDSLWMLFKELFEEHYADIVFGVLVPGAVWEVRAPNAPKSVGLLDGYVTVDFGAWHFHVCIGNYAGGEDQGSSQWSTARAELYRVLGKDERPRSWGVRLFNHLGHQQMTVFLPNPFLTPDGHIANAPDWSHLAVWDQLRFQYLGLDSDPFDRSGKGLLCGH